MTDWRRTLSLDLWHLRAHVYMYKHGQAYLHANMHMHIFAQTHTPHTNTPPPPQSIKNEVLSILWSLLNLSIYATMVSKYF